MSRKSHPQRHTPSTSIVTSRLPEPHNASGLPTIILPMNAAQPVSLADTPAARAAMDEEVRVLAYAKWEAAGYPAGDGVVFWLDAERELR